MNRENSAKIASFALPNTLFCSLSPTVNRSHSTSQVLLVKLDANMFTRDFSGVVDSLSSESGEYVFALSVKSNKG